MKARSFRLLLGLSSAGCLLVGSIPGVMLGIAMQRQQRKSRRLALEYPHMAEEFLRSMDEEGARLTDAGQKYVDRLKAVMMPSRHDGAAKKHPARIAGEVVRAGLVVAKQVLK